MRIHLTLLVLAVSVAAVVVGLGACGGSNFAGVTDDGGTDSTTVPGDDGSSGGGDGGGPQADGSSDVIQQPDTNPIVPPGPCTDVASDGLGTFASPNGPGTPATGCTLAAPCPSVTDALKAAVSNSRGLVYVDKGKYVEQLDLTVTKDHAVTVQGGWEKSGTGAGTTWKEICDDTKASVAIIEAPAGQNTTAIATDLNAQVTLDKINLHSRTTAPTAGESFYGLVAVGSSTKLKLVGVGISAAAGGAGGSGGPGATGSNATAGCGSGNGQTPAAGGAGAGASAGTFSGNAYQPAGGAVGKPGGTGGNGGLVAPACSTGATCRDCTIIVPPNGCGATDVIQVCGDPGVPGCGSGGGQGGQPGAGGGASIGVLIVGASVDASYASVGTAGGGAGGAGGSGGGPGTTTKGSAGAAHYCAATDAQCAGNLCQANAGTLEAGGTGMDGALGSNGGQGGGGAGGPTYAYYTSNGGSFLSGAFVTLQHGAGGAGGAGGSPAAASGASADHN